MSFCVGFTVTEGTTPTHAGLRLGASSLAERFISPSAVTSASLIRAATSFAIALPMAVTWTATVPEPATPIPRERITAEDRDSRLRDPLVSTVVIPELYVGEPVIEASVSFAMTFTAMATPTATPPLPATPKARASMLEVFLA